MSDENEEYECPKCGTIVDSYATSCPNCGYEFGNEEDYEDDSL